MLSGGRERVHWGKNGLTFFLIWDISHDKLYPGA